MFHSCLRTRLSLSLALVSVLLAGVLPASAVRAADEAGLLPGEQMVTASVGGVARQGPLVSQIAPVDPRTISEAARLYRAGKVTDADALAAGIGDETARAALEWLAIRTNPGLIRFARINRFIERYPDWPNGAALQRRAEEALSAERASPTIILEFLGPRTAITAVGRIALAQAFADTGRAAEAERLIRDVWRRDALSASTETLVLKRFGVQVTTDDHRVRTRALLLREHGAMALRAAARVDADYVRLAQAQLAAQRKHSGAASLLAAIPKALQRDPAYLFTQAMLHRRADRVDEAATALQAVAADALIGDGDAWWTERRLVARKLLDAGKPMQAYAIASQHQAEGGAARVEAEFHAGWIALRFLKDPSRALPHFERLAEAATTPHSRARAYFWQGQALAALQLPDRAMAQWQISAGHGATFHGQLARVELGQRAYVPAQASARPAVSPLAARSVLLLHNAGADEMAQVLLQDLATSRHDPGQIASLAAKLPLTATQRLTLGKIAHARSAPMEAIAYPIDGVPQVGAPEEVETPILHAIARQESAFNPHAVSSVGARGLMQMMPATARETAKRFSITYEPGRLTGDPAYSATLGAAHLADLLKAWRGSYVLTFAAYNAGSGNVRDWIAAYGDPRDPSVDVIDWIERIPFSETRHYVQKIMENLQVYRARLTGTGEIRIAEDLRRISTTVQLASTPGPGNATDVRQPAMP